MKVSIKTCLTLFVVTIDIIVFMTVLFLPSDIINKYNIFAVSNFIVLFILILFSIIPALIISRMITYPLKRIDRTMKTVATGKIVDVKHLKNYENFTEISDTIIAYTQMMETIKKNNFDLNSQQSKTEIILDTPKTDNSYRVIPLIDEMKIELKNHLKIQNKEKQIAGTAYNNKNFVFCIIDFL